jgi:hypothetical protein
MGQSKGGGYEKLPTLTPQQTTMLNQFLSQGGQNLQGAAAGYQQFLPGGGGGQAFQEQAKKNFEQSTIPSILNAFGSGTKGSSALNQALASGAANLNTDLAAKLADMQLQAAGGLGNLGLGQAGLGSKDQFAYAPKQTPFWQQLLLAGTNAAGQAARGWIGGK